MSEASDRLLTFLGPSGSFTHAAVDLLDTVWTGPVEPRDSVADVIFSVESGEADAGVVPLESSVEGDVSSTVDELIFRSSMCFITEELVVPVSYVIAGPPGARPGDVRRVVTTTAALAQCRRYVESLDADLVLVDTITAACAAVAAEQSPATAALTSAKAAHLHALAIVKAAVEDHSGVATRMALLGRAIPAPTGHDKTALVVTPIGDRTGVLADILLRFAAKDIALTAISSRPLKTRLGEYCFMLTARGHVSDTRLREALQSVAELPAEVKVVGSFPLVGGDGSRRVDEAAPPGSVGADTLQAWLDHLLRADHAAS